MIPATIPNNSLICPQGSKVPSLVPPGSYSDEGERADYRSSAIACGKGELTYYVGSFYLET